MRKASIKRNTNETQINLTLTLDAERGFCAATSGIGFFDHMLNSFCVHGGFLLEGEIKGDLFVDSHHTVEDTGIVLGRLFAEILADKSGIARFGESTVPMDESLARAVVDISGRVYLVFNAEPSRKTIGKYDTQLTREFFAAFAQGLCGTMHLCVLYGENEHHRTEALFKAAGRAMSMACARRGTGDVLSAKGVL